MFASGTVEYSINTSPASGLGISLNAAETEKALNGPVADIVFDKAGEHTVEMLLTSISETDFDTTGIRRILNTPQALESWRIGEAFAEGYLIEHRFCQFPWPDSRDERKTGSSLPGADLVGFQDKNNEVRFAFGEVKTSSELKYPPGTMFGRTGLKQQLEDLRDSTAIRDTLVKYLAHRTSGSTWTEQFRHACKRYLDNSADVRIFGVLIRDVPPRQEDISFRTNFLGKNCPPVLKIELIALYLPDGSIDQLSQKIKRPQRRDAS